MTDTIPAPEAPAGAELKIRGVLSAMEEAVTAVLASRAPSRFGQAARMCVMGQKIATELVTSVKEARQLEAEAAAGLHGPEAQYIAHGGGDVEGYMAEQQDYAILQGNVMQPAGPGVMLPNPRPNDQATLMRDLMMLVQTAFSDQKAIAEKKLEGKPETERDIYAELNEAIRARDALSQGKDAALRLTLEKKVEALVGRLAKDKGDDLDNTKEPILHVVPAELLRGHPPGTSLEPGNPFDPGGPVLHREGGCAGYEAGGEEGGYREEAVG